MKKFLKMFLALTCAVLFAFPVLTGCGEVTPPDSGDDLGEFIDYAGQLKLDMNSDTKKQEVTVKFFIDGDTTHFNPVGTPDINFVGGFIKARYLAVNTPESTGDVEKWGKTASNYTHSTLEGAEKIIVESDDDHWNLDSTNERYTLWIWYIPAGEEIADENFRNLNVQLLQEGYGRASKTSENRYGETALAALMQAQKFQLKIYGKEKDPNWFGNAAKPVTLKYLRCHIADKDEEGNDIYLQHPVSVSGYITARFESSVYIEEYDEATGVSYGIAVYYGYKTGAIVEILKVGNYVNVVGTVGEFNGTYQISGVSYRETRPNDPSNTQLIEDGASLIPTRPFAETPIASLKSGKITAEFEGEEEVEKRELDYGAAIMDTSVTLTNVEITDIYTTKNGNSAGAMSITVKDAQGTEITLRTILLYKADDTLYAEADFQDANGKYKKLSAVKGIVDYYDGAYQLAIWDFEECFTFAS